MAQHRVGNRILDQDEYDTSVLELWQSALFIIGAAAAGLTAHHYVPGDWPRWLRFAGVIAPGAGAGLVLGYLAPFIVMFVYMALTYGAIAGVLYWVWVSV